MVRLPLWVASRIFGYQVCFGSASRRSCGGDRMTVTRPYAMALMLSTYWSEAMRALISNGGMTVGELDRMIELKRALDRFNSGRDA
jgi:hypothetical protein